MYNLQRIHKLKYQILDQNNIRHRWIMKHKRPIQFIIVVCILVLVILTPFFHWKELFGLIVLGIISFFYSFKTKLGNLRSLPGMKIFWIAMVWALTVSVFTVGSEIQKEDIILFVYSFSFILSITIPFDIRDIQYDAKSFKTIPQVFGESISIGIAFLLLVCSFLCACMLSDTFSVFLSLVYGILALIICGASSKRKELYFSGLMDFTLVIAFAGHLLYEQIEVFHF